MKVPAYPVPPAAIANMHHYNQWNSMATAQMMAYYMQAGMIQPGYMGMAAMRMPNPMMPIRPSAPLITMQPNYMMPNAWITNQPVVPLPAQSTATVIKPPLIPKAAENGGEK
jgi:hypothetical protein